jgi:hypothetical protein
MFLSSYVPNIYLLYAMELNVYACEKRFQLYKDLLIDLVDEHLGWRQNYMPQDMPVISSQERNVSEFICPQYLPAVCHGTECVRMREEISFNTSFIWLTVFSGQSRKRTII